MCKWTTSVVILLAWVGVARAETYLTIKDDGLPLEQVPPELCNDRQIFVVTLTGNWTRPAATGATHYVNFFYPNGYHSAHAINSGEHEVLFNKGEIKAMLIDYEMRRGSAWGRGNVVVVVSHLRPAHSLSDYHVISNPVTLAWPMYRPVKRGQPAPAPAEVPARAPLPGLRPETPPPPPPVPPGEKPKEGLGG